MRLAADFRDPAAADPFKNLRGSQASVAAQLLDVTDIRTAGTI